MSAHKKEGAQQHSVHHTNPVSLLFFEGSGFPFLAWILFSALFYGAFAVFIDPQAAVQEISNEQIKDIFTKFTGLFGIGMALLSMIGMYLVLIVARIVTLTRYPVTRAVILILGFAPWLVFGYELVFIEVGRVDIARAIINFTGLPTLISSGIMVLLGIGWMVFRIIKRGASA